MATYRLWELIDLAMEMDGARSLHLTPGRPPMVRHPEQGIQPLSDTFPVLGYADIINMLVVVIEPERWEEMERVGEGEIVITPSGSGRPITLTLFRTSEAWAAVVHL